jgi:AcrR family transcriptional regulator
VPVDAQGSLLPSEVRLKSQVVLRERIGGGYERLKPGPGKSQESVVSHQRDRVHRAMVELVGAGSRPGITVRALARLAGVSTETFYALFDGVDDCLLSASGSVVEETCRRILARRSFRASRAAQCDRSVFALFDGLTNHPPASRLALLELFAGGPAALGANTAQETSLEHALRDAMSRRGDGLSTGTVTWIAAGALHAARGQLSSSRPREEATREVLEWARACLTESDAAPIRGSEATVRRPGPEVDPKAWHERDGERAMLRSAVQRLALKEGYWNLSSSRVSKAAGVPATHFKRHFRSLDDAYLDGIDELARSIFEPLVEVAESEDWTTSVTRQVKAVAERVAADECAARLALVEILAPGVAGVTRRERLIDDLASSWNAAVPAMGRIAAGRTGTALAGLWTTLARAVVGGGSEEVRRTAPTCAYLVLAPAVGGRAASSAAMPGSI